MLRVTRQKLAMLKGNGVIGIRREDKNNWERRVPLIPKHVKQAIDAGLKVIVQPSSIRCFSDEEYIEVGATISEDLSPAHTIVAVKEVPAPLLLPNRTYMYFSHTIKAQPYNMPMLDTALRNNIRLIDYERIVNKHGRIVKFGPYAGYAGVVDTLHALGVSLLARGIATPFLNVSLAKEYRSLEAARQDLLALGDYIRRRGLPKQVCPLTIVVTGSGAVSTAAQQMLHALPCTYVDPLDLEKIWENPTTDRRTIYVAIANENHLFRQKDASTPFDKQEYYDHPDRYAPIFHERIAPYTRVLLNCIYWEPKYPRLLSLTQTMDLHRHNRLPLLAPGDITCDPEGSIEIFRHSTTIGDPLYVYDLDKMDTAPIGEVDNIKNPVVILGVDHLPAEFPSESSEFFSDSLYPLAKQVALSDGTLPFDKQTDIPEELRKAVITSHGALTPDFQYIDTLRKKHEKTEISVGIKTILVLGSGLVAGPAVEYLLRSPQNKVVIADLDIKRCEALLRKWAPKAMANGRAIPAMVQAVPVGAELDSLIKDCDVVISLLPATLHASIMPLCLRHGKHLMTTSYVNPDMQQYAQAAEEKGLLFLNETGLDPGLDLMSSIDAISKLKKAGAVIEAYESICGALPSPEASDNALGYRFSWSPLGVMSAAGRDATWLYKGQEVVVPSEILYNISSPFDHWAGLNLFMNPNGDSVKYHKLYGFDDQTTTCIRGTFRFDRFARMVNGFKALGLLETLPTSAKNWSQLLSESIAGRCGLQTSKDLCEDDIKALLHMSFANASHKLRVASKNCPGLELYVADRVKPRPLQQEVDHVMQGLKTLHMLSENTPVDGKTRITALVALLEKELAYTNQTDFVLLHQVFTCRYANNKRTKFFSTICQRGQDPSTSATALTVGAPVAVATQLLLDGQITRRGLCRPITEDIYAPILKLCSTAGIEIRETEVDFDDL